MAQTPRRPGPEPPLVGDRPVLQLKVRLLGISPMIWRRLLVEESSTLQELHGVIQVAMGWESVHLFVFEFRAIAFGSSDLGVRSSSVSLKDLALREGEKLAYTYDMGADWRHEVRVEQRMQLPMKKRCPTCIAGARACPPEDSGGPVGYRRRREEATGLDALDDLDTLGQALREFAETGDILSLGDDDVRWRVEDALERTEARLSVLDDRFSRKVVNERLHRGDHRRLAEQQC